jgi:hypothetical protein
MKTLACLSIAAMIICPLLAMVGIASPAMYWIISLGFLGAMGGLSGKSPVAANKNARY